MTRLGWMLVILALYAAPVKAQTVCFATFDDQSWAKRTGEIAIVQGIVSSSSLLRVFANPKTGAFTVFLRSADRTCAMATGTDFEFVIQAMPGNPA